MMRRAALPAWIFAFALASAGTAPGAAATATAHARIVEGGVVRMNWSIAASSVTGSRNGANFSGTDPSMITGMVLAPRNARLTVQREDVAGGPVTAPTSFEVIRTDGENTLIVRTDANAEVRITSAGAVVYGSIPGSSAASIDVGHGLSRIATLETLSPPGRETLVVVVQYN